MFKYFDWPLLLKISENNILKKTQFIFTIVPLMSRLSYAIDDKISLLQAVPLFLDSNVNLIPINLLRLFWAAVFSLSSSYLCILFSPEGLKYKDFQEWLKSDESAINKKNILLKEKGRKKERQVLQMLRNQYLYSRRVDKRRALKYFLFSLHAIAFYLYARVLLDQLLLVYHKTHLTKLFF